MRWVHSTATLFFFYLMKLRHQDQQVQSQADWLRIDGVVEDTTREGTEGVLAIPRGSVTMDISTRDPNHTQSPLFPRPTLP